MTNLSRLPHRFSRSHHVGMGMLFHRLVKVLAGASESDLRLQIQYLRTENEILRSRLGQQVRVTPRERARLVKFGRHLGAAVASTVTIVSPLTFRRWIREARRAPRRVLTGKKPGRPRTPDEIRELVLRIANATGWGFTRIQGELRKLGITTVCRSTIINILKQANMPTAPDRNESTWYKFLRRHAETLWACDFLSQLVLTPTGWKQAFVLVFVHLGSRRAIASPATLEPSGEWLSQQVAKFAEKSKVPAPLEGSAPEPLRLIHDRDSLFDHRFLAAVRAVGIVPHPIPICAPNLNAHVERLQQTLQIKCLDKFLVMGTKHLDYLVSEYLDHYNTERPHSGIGFSVPQGSGAPPTLHRARDQPGPVGMVRCKERLGGVPKHYTTTAA